MKKSRQIGTEFELEVLTVMWEERVPLTSAQIVEKSVNKSWQDRSIHSLLNNLLKKNEIKVVGKVPTGKNLARQFEPTITREDYLAGQISKSNLYQSDWIDISFRKTVSNLIESSNDQDALVDELRALVNDFDKN